MNRKSAIRQFQKSLQQILDRENRVISTQDFLELISNAKTQEEKDIYCLIYNYLLQKKQQEVIANEKY